ncbi:MAG: fructose-6-phosphate aldolase [Bdellovibrionota bacterium]
MKFFLDTAITSELRQGVATGLVDGVTTNPSLIVQSGRKLEDVVKEITEIVDGPISVEAISTDAAGMYTEGKKFAAMHKNIVVKVPLTEAGLTATKRMSQEGIRVNVTLCFSANQALLAAKAGASYISPFVGRLDDIGQDGMQLIRDIVQIYKNYNFKTEVLAASLRHPIHIHQCALAGAHVGTFPFKVFQQLFKHPLTDIGLEKFLSDWKKAQG